LCGPSQLRTLKEALEGIVVQVKRFFGSDATPKERSSAERQSLEVNSAGCQAEAEILPARGRW